MEIVTTYDRSELILRAIDTLKTQLIEEMIRDRKAKRPPSSSLMAPRTVPVQVEVTSGRSKEDQARQLIDEMIRTRKTESPSQQTEYPAGDD